MIVSEARLAANRRNARKSTGPRTREGKDRSRENAVKHGLTSIVVVPEDAAEIQARAAQCFFSLKPRNKFQADLVDQVAILQLRTERCQRIESKLRDQVSLRAMTSWDEDRRLAAEVIASDLSRRPGESACLLRRTPQGCDLLIGYWAMLARAAKVGAGWDDDARSLAFDLLGTPRGVRVGNPGETIDLDGLVIDPGEDPAAFARSRIAELREAREAAAEHDAVEREMAESDLTDEATPEIRRLRRHEAALNRQLRWTLERLKDPLPTHLPAMQFRPNHCPQPEEEVEAEVRAEMAERAASEARFEAQYYSEKPKTPAQAAAQARRRAENEANAGLGNEPTPEVGNEATAEVGNEPIPAAEGAKRSGQAPGRAHPSLDRADRSSEGRSGPTDPPKSLQGRVFELAV